VLGFVRKLPPDSAFGRELAGDAAGVTLADQILARVELHLAGANWQRGGGKGMKPKPIELPNARKKHNQTFNRDNVVERLRRLGHIA